jgi:hypothetical protein
VNDVGTREELRKSLGFCNWHAWKSLEVQNCPLGLGIIYNDMLERIQERLAKVQHSIPVFIPFIRRLLPRGKVKNSNRLLRPSHSCPVCQSVRFFEETNLGILLDFISERDFERQMKKYESLQGEVSEFIRKHDYQYAHEPRGAESDSWKRALEMVVGKREIFPSQMDRRAKEEEAPSEKEITEEVWEGVEKLNSKTRN